MVKFSADASNDKDVRIMKYEKRIEVREKLKKRGGYTLVEILVASTIFVSVVSMGVATYSSASGFQSKSEVIRETNQAARYAMDTMVRDIKTADSSVLYSITEAGPPIVTTDYVFRGVALAPGGSIKKLNDSAPSDEIRIYRKGKGACAKYVEEVVYKIENQAINQSVNYYEYDNGDVTDPANHNMPTGLLSGCKGNTLETNVTNLLGDRVQLANDGSASFKGNVNFTIDGVEQVASLGGTYEAAKIKISMDVEPRNSANNSSTENRIIHLETTVVPRNVEQ